MLVATDPVEAAGDMQPDAPAVKGDVVLGAESRIVVEPIEEAAQVFYLLDMREQRARVPVNPPAPFEFDLPAGAVGATIMERSSPNCRCRGAHISVQGPFPPGHLARAGGLSDAGDDRIADDRAALPALLEQLAVVGEEVGRHDAVVRAGQRAARGSRAGRGVHRGDRRRDRRWAAAASSRSAASRTIAGRRASSRWRWPASSSPSASGCLDVQAVRSPGAPPSGSD